MPTLDTGDQIPEISLPRDGGGSVSLSEFIGQQVVLFFYPKDDTSGCTKEAIAFSGLSGEFAAADTVVLGISKDNIRSHDKFVAKHNLLVPLLSDEDVSICQLFGVWVEKSMYGRKYMGVERSTFLISKSGTITKSWRKVKVPGHAEDVLKAATA